MMVILIFQHFFFKSHRHIFIIVQTLLSSKSVRENVTRARIVVAKGVYDRIPENLRHARTELLAIKHSLRHTRTAIAHPVVSILDLDNFISTRNFSLSLRPILRDLRTMEVQRDDQMIPLFVD